MGAADTVVLAQSAVHPVKIRYRLLSVQSPGEQDGCDVRAFLKGMALNDCGVVVGQIATDLEDVSCELEPFVWSFCDNPYLPEAERGRNLANLTGEPTFDGIALDVSNAGDIVGYFGDNATGPDFAHPWVWRMSSYNSSTDLLDSSFALGTGEFGQAASLNNESDPMIVGHYYDGSSQVAFRSRVSSPSLVDLPFTGGEAFAMHVTTPSGSSPARAVGADFGSFSTCGAHDEALLWIGSAPSASSSFDEDPSSATNYDLWRAVARASNSSLQAVGTRTASEGGSCRTRAIFWDEVGEPVVIGSGSGFSSNEETAAYSLSEADSLGRGVLITGGTTNQGNETAVLWWRNPADGGIVPIRANELTLVQPGGYTLNEFRDVNAMGWILGNGTHPAEPLSRTFVLVPDPCNADFNLDGMVDGADLTVVLGAWGYCSGSGYCAGDLDYSGAVDGADMSILLGQWGDCGYSETTQLACLASACASPPSESMLFADGGPLDQAVQFVGFESTSDLVEWLSAANDSDALALGEILASVIESMGGDS